MGGKELTLWVVLRTILLTSGVERDDLVADDVVSALNVGGDGEGGGDVVG